MSQAHVTSAAFHAPGSELRAQLVDMINHELRTPLTTLLGHTELLQDLDLPEMAQESLTAIARAGERLRHLATTVTEIVELDRRAVAGAGT